MRYRSLLLLFALTLPISTPTARDRAVRRLQPTPPAVAHYRGGSARNGVYITSGVRTFHDRKWLATVAGDSFSPPVFANGTLYLDNGSGRIVALDATNGAVKWTSPI